MPLEHWGLQEHVPGAAAFGCPQQTHRSQGRISVLMWKRGSDGFCAESTAQPFCKDSKRTGCLPVTEP